MEEWKRVNGFEWLEVSNLGHVRTLDSVRPGSGKKPAPQKRQGTLMSPFLSKGGYLTVAPKIGQSRRKIFVHRLVAMSFVPGFFAEATVNHIDGNKLNNHANNLEWITKSENTKHQWRIGLANLRGKNNKLSKEQVIEIRQSAFSNAHLSRIYGVRDSTICLIRQRKIWAWL